MSEIEPLTADTVTDEQIRELQRVPWTPADPAPSDIARMFHIDAQDYTIDALQIGVPSEVRRFARARCAEIINARRAQEHPIPSDADCLDLEMHDEGCRCRRAQKMHDGFCAGANCGACSHRSSGQLQACADPRCGYLPDCAGNAHHTKEGK